MVLHVIVHKSRDIKRASDGKPYIRRGPQSLPVKDGEALRRLEFAKGVQSFETDTVQAPIDFVTESDSIKYFIENVVPRATPDAWLRKQLLIKGDKPTVGGALLFADEPQAILPKRCGIKVYRFKSKDLVGTRDTMAFTPITVEGCLYS